MYRVSYRLLAYGFAAVGIYGAWLNYQASMKAQEDALARNVYWESLAAKEPELSSRIVAHVTVLRADKDRTYWGGADIAKVVFARAKLPSGKIVCQFSWTCDDAKRDAALPNTPAAALARRIAKEELAGTNHVPAAFAEAVSYNNPKYSKRAYVCNTKLALVDLGKAEEGSQHEFYREAVTLDDFARRPVLKEVPECHPKRMARPAKPRNRKVAGTFLSILPTPYIYVRISPTPCGFFSFVLLSLHADEAEEDQNY